MTGVAAAVTAFLGIVSVLLELWVKQAPARDKEREDARNQKGRQAVIAGDVDAVQQRIDGLLSEVQGDSSAGKQSDESISERFSAL